MCDINLLFPAFLANTNFTRLCYAADEEVSKVAYEQCFLNLHLVVGTFFIFHLPNNITIFPEKLQYY